MDQFFTWQILATFVGAAGATALITQFLKDIFSKAPTQLVSYGVAFLILIAATAATTEGIVDWSVWGIIPLNAVIVSLSANGGYAVLERAKGKNE